MASNVFLIPQADTSSFNQGMANLQRGTERLGQGIGSAIQRSRRKKEEKAKKEAAVEYAMNNPFIANLGLSQDDIEAGVDAVGAEPFIKHVTTEANNMFFRDQAAAKQRADLAKATDATIQANRDRMDKIQKRLDEQAQQDIENRQKELDYRLKLRQQKHEETKDTIEVQTFDAMAERRGIKKGSKEYQQLAKLMQEGEDSEFRFINQIQETFNVPPQVAFLIAKKYRAAAMDAFMGTSLKTDDILLQLLNYAAEDIVDPLEPGPTPPANTSSFTADDVMKRLNLSR